MRTFYPLLFGIAWLFVLVSHLSVLAETALVSDDSVSYSIDDNLSLPIDPSARALVLERLVPTKKLASVPLLQAVMRVSRVPFVPRGWKGDPYTDLPIPLGSGNTLSSPFETVYALEKLHISLSDRVWIVGAGTGYAAAIASQLADDVTIGEMIPSLIKKNGEAFKVLGVRNVRIRGMSPKQINEETESFDKILILNSFPKTIPGSLIDRLAENGILIAPVGARYTQRLCQITKTGGDVKTLPLINVCPKCRFDTFSEKSDGEQSQAILDESFEYTNSENFENIPGWFETRNVVIRPDTTAPEGESVLWFDSLVVRTEQKRKDAIKRKEMADREDSWKEKTELPDLCLTELTLRQRKEELSTLAIRAFRLDGTKIRKVDFSCSLEGIGIVSERKHLRGVLAVSLAFFDEDRNPLREIPLVVVKTGNTSWQEYRQDATTVPKRTREAEIRIGLMGGYGILKADAISIKSAENLRKKGQTLHIEVDKNPKIVRMGVN
jgi:protein-L-isoaspartate(D-aspartate) O-methyltransferase